MRWLRGFTGDRRSFELYRRNLYESEIPTFDELQARTKWLLAEAEEHDH